MDTAGGRALGAVGLGTNAEGRGCTFFTSLLTTDIAEKVEEQDLETETEACRFVKLGGRKLTAATDTGSSHGAGMTPKEPGTRGD